MKKFELANKSIVFFMIFIMLPFWVYTFYGYFYIILFGVFLSIFICFVSKKKYGKSYFNLLFISVLFLVVISLGAIYLTTKDGWLTILKYLFIFLTIDFCLTVKKMNLMQKKYKYNVVCDDNLDKYSISFEVKNGKVWGDGLFFQIGLFLYMIIIGPYFIVINSPFTYYAGDMMAGLKSNLSVYAIILMVLIFWEYTLKRFYFFGGLNYEFKNKIK